MTAYTRTEHLRHELASQIRNGTLKPGSRIMSETRLAEEYQVSRGTVRRALEQLKRAELIETRMGSGSYVAFNGGSMSGPHNFGDDGALVEYVRSFLDPGHFTLHITTGENGGNHGSR